MSQLIQKTLVGNTRVGVANRSPLLRNNAFLGRVVALNPMVRDLIRGAVWEHAKRFLQTAIQRIYVYASHHIARVVLGALHERLAHCNLMPGLRHTRLVHAAAELVHK